MNISSRCEYACRAIVELAASPDAQAPLTTQEIAERRNIPEKYLVHILLQLKRAGIVRSVRGAQGGYHLAQSPEQISVGDIIRAIDGAVLDPLPADDDGGSDIVPTWRALAKDIDAVLESTTVRDILDRAATANMYYI